MLIWKFMGRSVGIFLNTDAQKKTNFVDENSESNSFWIIKKSLQQLNFQAGWVVF